MVDIMIWIIDTEKGMSSRNQ